MSEPVSIVLLGVLPDPLREVLDKLAEQGTSVQQVDGAYRLVAAFAADPADVAVIDLEDLRQKDLEILRVLRDIRPDVGIVVLAGRDQRDLAADALCEGADLYLLKPAYAEEFMAAIERAGMRRRLAGAEREGPPPSDSLYKLAQGIAHEINNPLTTISGWLQVLGSDHAKNKRLADVLGSMREEADRIADVVRQLLLFAQQASPRIQPMDVGRILIDLGRSYSAKCRDKGAELVTEIAPELPPVAGDAELLRQAFDTILAEAEAAVDGSGHIEVSCRPKNQGVQIVFRDDGVTISVPALARIFDPFHDGRDGTGNGMRLSLTKGIIGSHRGTIEAESTESDGTRFTVWLPSERGIRERA